MKSNNFKKVFFLLNGNKSYLVFSIFLFSILIFNLFNNDLFAKEEIISKDNSITNASYELASKSDQYLKFEMSSTKLGLITTSFTSFVKNFKISTLIDSNKALITLTTISFLAADIDTDNSSRNDKMYQLCLEKDKYPEIKIFIKEPISLKEPSIKKDDIVATLFIRGKEYPIKVSFEWNLSENKKSAIVKGHSNLKLSELEIPDPSIVIAKVKDDLKVQFNVVIESSL